MSHRSIYCTVLSALAVLGLGVCTSHAGPISYSGGTYSQDFDSLPNTGSDSPWTNGTTLTGWHGYGGSSPTNTPLTTILTTDGDPATENVLHSLGTGNETDRALGGRQFKEPFRIAAEFTNDTNVDITEVTIDYIGEQWRAVVPGAADNFNLIFQYSLDATAGNEDSATWVAVSPLELDLPVKTVDTTTTLDGNLAANRSPFASTFTLSSDWTVGSSLWIRWTQAAPNTPQGAIPGIDDFSFTATIPEPASFALFALAGSLIAVRRRG